MKNKIKFFLVCVLLSGSLAFSEEDKENEKKEALISSHVDYVKASIDKKCQKLNKKIKNYEEQLCNLDNYSSNEVDSDLLNDRRTGIMKRIKKCEDKIDNLRIMKVSVETINFSSI